MLRFLLILCFLFPLILHAQIAKIEQSLLQPVPQKTVEALVLLHKQLQMPIAVQQSTKEKKGAWVYENGRKLTSNTQKRLHNFCIQNKIDYTPFVLVNALYINATPKQLLEISTFSEVKYIGSNQPLKRHHPITSTSRTLPSTWGLDSIRATQLQAKGITGKTITVGGQDTGYDWEHPAIQSNYRGYQSEYNANHNYNWHDAIKQSINPSTTSNPCGFDSKTPCDDNAHGTHTMGTVLGQTTQLNIGVAPNAQWIGCRNMDNGHGTLFTYLDCFNWFLAPTDLENKNENTDLAPHVLVNSWGCPTSEGCNNSNFEVLRIAIHNLRLAGIVVVVSAGNDGSRGCETVQTPAAIYGESFVVAATNSNNNLARFSSRGPVSVDSSYRMKPDISAPGVDVYSAILNDQYNSFSGTSMAGPHVAGAIALLFEADPSLIGHPDKVETLLKQTAQPVGGHIGCGNIAPDTYPNFEAGHGLINLWEALKIIRPDLTKHLNLPTKKLFIAPNPTYDNVTLYSPEPMGNCQLRVYSLTGKQLLTKAIEMYKYYEFDTKQLESGAYILQIQNEKQTYTNKLLKY